MTQGRAVAGKLDSEAIVEAALRIFDLENDVDGLTIRRLAAELGVGTMTLYSYFRGKDEILDAMADHVLGRMEMPPPAADEDTATALRVVGHSFLAMLRSHPSVRRMLATRVTTSLESLRGAMEAVLDRLVNAGIPGPLAVQCYGFLITYAMGFASYQAPRPWGRGDDDDSIEARRRRRHFYLAMPATDFPRVLQLADHLVNLPSDDQFDFGLDAFIEAVLARIRASS
jgi:AcrR family transcriptional regulator